MRLPHVLALLCACLATLPVRTASAEVLTGAARREYEKATSEGNFSTACSATAPYFVFWAGKTPSVLDVEGRQQPVTFTPHKVGDYIKTPYRCQTAEGVLTIKNRLTHTISNAQCGAGNDFIATLSVSHLGSYSDDFLVDGCGGTSGLLVQGKHVLLCRMPDDDQSLVGHCAEAVDAKGPRQLH